MNKPPPRLIDALIPGGTIKAPARPHPHGFP